MIYLRKAKLSDLEAIIAFSEEAHLGITSLPQNPDFHARRLKAAQNSTKTGIHLFSLVKKDKVIGICGFFRKGKRSHPMRIYQKKQLHLQQPDVKVDKKMEVLELKEIPRPFTEVGTLFLQKKYRGLHLGPLLSFSRFLYMANFPKEIDNRLIASLRGVSYPDGSCPFWDAVGIHFYGHNFRQADFFRSEKMDAMTQLFPKTPIYVSLLPYVAQNVLGKTHDLTTGALSMLLSQGFQKSQYIDLFDGGPYLSGTPKTIHALSNSECAQISAISSHVETPSRVIISNTHSHFRSTLSHVTGNTKGIVISKDCAEILQVKLGDKVRYLPMREY